MDYFDCCFNDINNLDTQETEQMPVSSSDLSDEISDDWFSVNSQDEDIFISTDVTSVPMSPPPVNNSDAKPQDSNAIQVSFVHQQLNNNESVFATSCNPNQLDTTDIPLDSQKGKKKNIYGHGSEVEKLKRRNADYLSKDDYHKLEVYKGFGSPQKQFFLDLGENFNHEFKDKIKIGEMEKFGRDQKRNLKCAVIFFQKRLPNIYTFLIDHGFNTSNVF